ncbi:MAG: ATP-binding protein, partial [Maricaulaceae bacterium]
FLANASHELRTPLASLMGFIETLRGHARDDEAARERFLGIISDQAERMRRLIDDLLSLSRIEQTERVTPTDTVNLAAVVEDVADALAPLADDQKVSLEIGQRVADARVLGDRDELVQVVQNLIENAVKYTDPGGRVGIDLGVAVSAQDAFSSAEPLAPDAVRLTLLQPEAPVDGEFAWVRVTDSGRGIERRHLPRLSERFFRGDSDMAASIEGTGLGLAIVRHVMARHRGGLAVESAVGAGSRFTILAPIENSRAAADRPAEAAADRSESLDRRGNRAAP